MTTHESARGSLRWAIRETLLNYVTVIAGGSVDSDGVDLDDQNRFVFPLRRADLVDGEWHLYFSGSVSFTAHHGFLHVLVADPEVILGTNGGALATRTEEGNMIPLALLRPSTPQLEDLSAIWETIPSTLMSTGVDLFGGVYDEGSPLAPLRIALSQLDTATEVDTPGEITL